MQWCHLSACVLLAFFCLFFILTKADDIIIQKREYNRELEEAIYDPKRKKPFCNAFTGCGRKRSDESMSALVELNSEPAVEELSRQILSEAKLWEAIQEARLEILKKQEKTKPLPIAIRRRRMNSQQKFY